MSRLRAALGGRSARDGCEFSVQLAACPAGWAERQVSSAVWEVPEAVSSTSRWHVFILRGVKSQVVNTRQHAELRRPVFL